LERADPGRFNGIVGMSERSRMPIKKILVVDDSPTERYFLNEMLIKHGFLVSTAENAEEAMIKLQTQLPDLILMDIVMPGLNGFQFTRQLSKDPVTQNIPVIMCTSKSQQTDRIWGLRQGARDYLTKPIRAEDLLEKIAALG
jgi:twitching motility two-component system response regulator PilH